MGPFARAAASTALVCVAAAACEKAPAPPPAVCGAPQGASSDAQSLASSDTAFAVALFPPVVAAQTAGVNVVVSPYSVSSVLTMVEVGAAGETDTQIQSVLALTGDGATLAPAYAALACADETDGTSSGQELSVANALWGQQGTAFSQSFLSVMSSGYDAPLQQVDFTGDPGAAAGTIDAWVSSQTQGEIPSLLSPGSLDATTRLVLVNAVYFKGQWATGFDASLTQPRTFTLSGGTQESVPTMDADVTVGEGTLGSASVYELAYKGGALAMDFVLPTGSAALSDVEAAMTPATLGAALGSLAPTAVELQLPKFSFTSTLVLDPILGAMGMPDLFDPAKANLSGMDGQMDLYVKTVVQQAIVEVDETGTVAAAATEATGDEAFGAEYPPPVAIDHPFLFLIRDTKSGSILFMGHVEDPSS